MEIAYINKAEADPLIQKSEDRLRATKFYHRDTNYSDELQQSLFVPSIDRVLNMLSEGFRSISKIPKIFGGLLLFISGVISSFRHVIRNVIKKQLIKVTSSVADNTKYQHLKPITIRIISNHPIRTFRKDKIKITTVKNNGRQ